MATTKITDLTAYTDPVNTDVLPIVDVTSDVTKKVSIANVMKNASLGTAAAPGIAFDGDSNTGIYSPGADQVAISTGGSGRLFVEADGDVCIGQNAGNSQLTVKGSTSARTVSQFIANDTNTTTMSVWERSDGAVSSRLIYDGTGLIKFGTSTAHALTLDTSNQERLRITSAGLVGIGTSTVGDTLHVKGSSTYGGVIVDNSAATGGGAFRAYRNGVQKAIFCADSWVTGTSSDDAAIYADAGGGIKFYTNNSSTAKAVLTSGGSLGIGSTSPSSTLTVGGNPPTAGAIGAVGASGGIALALSDNVNCSMYVRTASGGAVIGTDAGGVLRFATNGNAGTDEKARIDSSGRLLVGTSTATTAGELLRVEKASTGTEGTGIRFGGTYSLADGATQSFTVGNGALVFISENIEGDGALFFCSYRSATVTLLSDPNNRYANSDTATKICVFKSANSGTVSLKNRLGSTGSFTIGKVNNSD